MPALPHSRRARCADILNEREIKLHRGRYYLERRDPEFKQKMAEVLCVYREVKLVKEMAGGQKGRAQRCGGDRLLMMRNLASRRSPPRLPDLPPVARQARGLRARR